MRHIITMAKNSGETGAECRESGPYRCRGPVETVVFIRKGERFPAGVDGSATRWVLVGRVERDEDDRA